jgi:hypothetical protein
MSAHLDAVHPAKFPHLLERPITGAARAAGPMLRITKSARPFIDIVKSPMRTRKTIDKSSFEQGKRIKTG